MINRSEWLIDEEVLPDRDGGVVFSTEEAAELLKEAVEAAQLWTPNELASAQKSCILY